MKSLVVESTVNPKQHLIGYAALFHLKFDKIHPFVNRNGQTWHLILNQMLMEAGYKPLVIDPDDLISYKNAIIIYDDIDAI